MKELTFAEILEAVGGRLAREDAIRFKGVSIDTRTLAPGELFVAIRGENFDGHRFIAEAMAKGAAGVVLSDDSAIPEQGTTVVVGNTRAALSGIAGYYRRTLDPRVVAVTGSNGKTTTRDMIGALLGSRFATVTAEGSFNNDIGVPLTVFRLEPETEAAVFEIEMNELGGTRRLTRVCQPQVGVVTNIGDTHLESMGDRDGVAAEKVELVEELPAGGLAMLNADDDRVLAMRKRAPCRVVTYGVGPEADVRATDIIESGLDGIRFTLQEKHSIRLSVPGRVNVWNALAACAAAHACGLGYEAMPDVLGRFRPPDLRMNVRKTGDITVIADCYNSNPQSVRAALDLLAGNTPPARRVAFLGDMLELGAESEPAHVRLGQLAAELLDRVCFVGRLAEKAASAAIGAGMESTRVHLSPDSVAAKDERIDIVAAGDTILVKGSRATGMELIVKALQEKHGN